jgi:hypothetical protein
MSLIRTSRLIFIMCILSRATSAQVKPVIERCGTLTRLEKIFERDPAGKTKFEEQRDEFNRAVRERTFLSQVPGRVTSTYVIPVVFHVVLTDPSQVTDAQIFAQLDVLNKDYSGTNADSSHIPSFFKPLFGKSPISFCLAQRTPAGEATSGIERTVTGQASFAYMGDQMKYASSGGADAWDPSSYYNIWICALSGNLLGYATFPGVGVPEAQGVVVDYRSLPGGPYTNYNGGKTLSHETGHYFNLYHIWGDDNGACTGTDYVDDTPNQANFTTGCYSGVHTDACTPGGDGIMYENYMDYSYDDCLVMFTPGQVARMESALLAYRSSLLVSNACQPLVQYDYDVKLSAINSPAARLCASSYTPAITIKNMGSQTLTSVMIHYQADNGVPNSISWSGSLAQYASTDLALPIQDVSDGAHELTVYLSNPNNQVDQNMANDTLSTSFFYFASSTALQEGFEDAGFPPGGWDLVNADHGITWGKVTGISHGGSSSVKIDNFDYTNLGQKDDLRLPMLRIDNKDSAFLSFYVAAAIYSPANTAGNTWDTLEVLMSRDCGASYTSLYKKYGGDLATAPQPVTTAFVPSATEWRKDSVNLGSYIDAGDILLAFRNTTGNENNIYLDDINLRTVVVNSNLKKQGFLVTPSPTTGSIQVQFYPQPDKLAGIQLFTSTGQLIAETRIPVGQANNLYTYDLSPFATGLYIVKAIFTDRVLVRKVFKH